MKITRLEATTGDGERVGSFLLESFAKEHRFGSMTSDVDVLRAWDHVADVLANGVVWIAEDDAGVIYGSVSVVPTQLWWSARTYLSDGWFYVHPSARGTPAHIMLLEAAEAHAVEDGRPLVVEVFNSIKPALVGKMLHRRGYADLGGRYIKEA